LVTVSVTVYVPALVYVWEGFCEVDVPPSPNDQTQDVGEFMEESTNCTVSGASPDVTEATKNAVGISGSSVARIYSDCEIVFAPLALVTVSVTV